MSIGSRASYYSLIGKFYFEPRLLASYSLTKNITLKLNAGIYHQFINHIYGAKRGTIGGIRSLNWQLSDYSFIQVPKNKQISIGAIYQKKGWTVDLDGYAKNIQNITASNFITKDVSDDLITGSYQTLGIDFLLKKSVKKFESWIAYSYSSSVASFDSISFQHVWNQSHVLNAVVAYNYKNWRIATGWKYASGIENTSYRTTFILGERNNPSAIPNQGSTTDLNYVEGSAPAYSTNFPSNHSLNVSSSMFFFSKSKKHKITFGLAVNNIYDNRTIIGQADRIVPGPAGSVLRVNKTGFGRMYSGSIKLQWK